MMTDPAPASRPQPGPNGRAGGRAAQPPTLWDPLVRISHWGIAGVVLANAVFTSGGSWLHVSIGWIGLSLLLLRLVWGMVGPHEARFSAFPPNPMAAVRHLREVLFGRPRDYGSHNPAGAMMVYALWACLAIVTFTGLVMTDFATPIDKAREADIVATGDWSQLAKTGEAAEDGDEEREGTFKMVEEIHEVAANLILFLAFLHVAGVFVESRAMRRNLLAPMLFGAGPKGRS